MNNGFEYEFKELLEEKFGLQFSITILEISDFLDELINKGYDENEIVKAIIFMYRDDLIDFASLRDLFDRRGYDYPQELGFYAEKAKILLRDTALKCNYEDELYNLLYFYYQNDKIDYNVYKTAMALMYKQFTEEFENMTDLERKTKSFFTDNKGNVHILTKEASDLLKCFNSIIETNVEDFFVPTKKYDFPMDFIYDYMDTKGIEEKILSKNGLDRRLKHRLKTQLEWDKLNVYRFIFILDMSLTESKQFMTLCGYTFSPLLKSDLFFLDYLNGKYPKVKTLDELSELSEKAGASDFKFNEWC